MSKYERMLDWASKKGVKIAYKDESILMKVLSKVLFFNKRFMTDYVTTVGSTIYFPSREWERKRKAIGQYRLNALIAHEVTHVLDMRDMGRYRFVWDYLFPQGMAVFGLLSLAAFWNVWMLAFLLFFASLYKWPSRGREAIEVRGYAASLAALYWDLGIVYEDDPEWVISQFTGPAYYYMSDNRKVVTWRFRKVLEEIYGEQITESMPHLKDVKEILRGQ